MGNFLLKIVKQRALKIANKKNSPWAELLNACFQKPYKSLGMKGSIGKTEIALAVTVRANASEAGETRSPSDLLLHSYRICT